MKPTGLTARAQQLLDTLRAAGDWQRRSDLARRLNMRRLSPHDAMLLDRLHDMKLIDIEERPARPPLPPAYWYKARSE